MPRITFYKSKDGWRWRVVAANGRILADSGDSYKRINACRRGAERALAVLRYSLKITAGLLLFASLARAQAPAVPSWPGDFAYLGSTTLPAPPYPGVPPNGDTTFGKGLAIRAESDGSLTLFTGSWNPQVVLEWRVVKNASGTFSGSAVFQKNRGSIPFNSSLFGLYWDRPTSTLYASSQNDYDSNPEIGITLGRATINASTGQLVAGGSFTFAGRSDKFTQGGISALPDWFQRLYGCGRLAVGYGGYQSVIATGPASMGPAFACFDPPAAGVSSGAITNTSLLAYPFSSSTVVHTPAAERDTDYTQVFGWGWWPESVVTPPGYWVPGDSLWQGCAYVDTGAVSGLVCVPMVHNGCVWYGSNAVPQTLPSCSAVPGKSASLNSDRAHHWVFIYDPADLGSVALGNKAQNAIQAVHRVELDLPGVTQPLTGWPNIPRMVTGVSFEPTTGLFAVMIRNTSVSGGRPTIFWYQVRNDGLYTFTATRTRTVTTLEQATVTASGATAEAALIIAKQQILTFIVVSTTLATSAVVWTGPQ